MAINQESDVQGFDDKPQPMSRRKKIWIGVAAGAVIVLGSAGLIIPQFLDQAKYKALIQQKVADATGYSVDWTGDIGISILPLPTVSLDNLVLANGAQKIVTLKEAEVRVALMPLLDKRVEIASVNLVEPDVSLVVDKQGNSTWMTSRLSNKTETSPAEGASSSTQTSSADVVLNALKISNGRLSFKNEQEGSEQVLENLNANLQADSLEGPFLAKGDVLYAQKKIEFDLKAGEIKAGTKEYPLQGKIALPALNVNGEYAGVIATDPMKVDGELTVAAKDLEKTIEAFSGNETKLPEGLEGQSELKAKLLYDGEQAALNNMRVAVGELAYNGAISVKNLKSEVPPLTIDLTPEKKGSKSASGLVGILDDLSVKGTGSYANNRVKIDNGNVVFQGQKIALAGTYAMPAKTGQRPNIDFTVKADRLDLDELTGSVASAGGKESGKGGSSKSEDGGGLTGMSLPFDGKLRADIGTLVTGGKTYSPLSADIVSKGNALTINSLNVGMAADTTIQAKGSVGNLSALSDFDIDGSVKTSDAESLMKALNVQGPALQQKIGPASVSGKFQGSLKGVAFNATVNALSFAVTGQGNVATPMTDPVISELRLNVKHPQLGEAIRTFQPGFQAPPSLRGPLDLSTTLAWDKSQYTLGNIKGTLGGTGVAGAMNIAMTEKPSVKGNLEFGDLVFDATKGGSSSSSASGGGNPTAGGGSDGKWSREAINTSWMRSFDADIAVKARSITQDLWKLSNVNLAFDLSNGTLNIRDVSAGLFGGQAVINGLVKSGTTERDPLSLSVAMNASNLDARQLHSALTGKASDTLSGTVSNFKLDVNSSGISPSALVQALNGNGDINGKNVIIKGIDAAQLAETAKGSFKPLERAGSLFQTFQDGQTQFDTMDVVLDIKSGIVTFPQLKFDGPRAMIEGKSGNVSLPRWMIDLVTTVTVKNTDIPPFDLTIRGPLDNPLQAGGNIIEGYLRDKAQKKIEKVIGKELEKRFGIPFGASEEAAPAPSETAPASGTEAAPEVTAPAPAEAAPAEKKITPEEEAVKALQNLFGR